MRTAAALVLAAILAAPALGREAAPEPAPPPPRPRLALVLSGGGARGAAHIGVLRVLEERRVVPDLIVGTSMGSIVGGLYAAGWSPDEIEGILRAIDWGAVFIDRVPRELRSFRRRTDDDPSLIQSRLRFKGLKPYMPPGLLGGQHLDLLLSSLEYLSTGETDFDRLPIPYRAVGADIVTGEAVVLSRGSLARAMRASMSVGGAFAPVEIEGRLLVDGGAVANLPVGIAQSLGAERVIAVDISTPLSGREELASFLNVVDQVTGLLTVGNRSEDVKRLRPGDVLIVPVLGELGFGDFARSSEAVAMGAAAARRHAAELDAFAVSPDAWAAFKARHHPRPAEERVVDEVALVNRSALSDGTIRSRLVVPAGRPLTATTLQDAVGRLSGLDAVGRVSTTFRRVDGRGHLAFDVGPRPYGRGSLQFGLSLEDDFRGEGTYTLSARFLVHPLGDRGGEWRTGIQAGTSGVLLTEYYQPLDLAMRWFVAPAAEYRRENLPIFLDDERITDYRWRSSEGRAEAGRVLGDWGEIRVGAFRSGVEGEVRVGPPALPNLKQTEAGVRVGVRLDTLDSRVYPRRGAALEVRWTDSSTGLGSDVPFRAVSAEASCAVSFGRNTLAPALDWTENLDEPSSLPLLASVGGLWRLSGLAPDQLLDAKGGVARLVYYRRLGEVEIGPLRQTLYLGGSLETGGAFAPEDGISLRTLEPGGSIFLGADTFLGPAYLAVGFADRGRTRYLFGFGDRF